MILNSCTAADGIRPSLFYMFVLWCHSHAISLLKSMAKIILCLLRHDDCTRTYKFRTTARALYCSQPQPCKATLVGNNAIRIGWVGFKRIYGAHIRLVECYYQFYIISTSITSSTMGAGAFSLDGFGFGDLIKDRMDPKTPFFLRAPPARPAVSELLERLRAGKPPDFDLVRADLVLAAAESFLVLLFWLSKEAIFRGSVRGVAGALVPRRTGLVLFLLPRRSGLVLFLLSRRSGLVLFLLLLRGGFGAASGTPAVVVVVWSSRLLLRWTGFFRVFELDDVGLVPPAEASLLPLLVRDAVLSVRVDNCRLLLFVGGGGRVPRSRRVGTAVARVPAVAERVLFTDRAISPSPAVAASSEEAGFLDFRFSLVPANLEFTLVFAGLGDTFSSSSPDIKGGGGGGAGTRPCCIRNLCCLEGV